MTTTKMVALMLFLWRLNPAYAEFCEDQSGNGFWYDPYNDICCDGVVTTGVSGYYDYDQGISDCCGSVGFDTRYGRCCDGVVQTGISQYYGEACQITTTQAKLPKRCEIGTANSFIDPVNGKQFDACEEQLLLGDSGHIIPEGLSQHNYYYKIDMAWYLHAKDLNDTLIVLCPTYLDIAYGDLLYFQEISEVVDGTMKTPYLGPNEIYYGKEWIPQELDGIEELMNLTCKEIETGKVLIYFQINYITEASTGWDITYTVRSRIKNRPQDGARIPVGNVTQQVEIPENVKEFTWKVEEGERIWIQVIHMDLTTNVSELLEPAECSISPNRVEIYEGNSSTNSSILALLCRNPFNMTPVTLVTEGNYAFVRMFCNQGSGKDCVTINFKTYKPEKDADNCPEANNDETNSNYSALVENQFSNLTYTFDQESTSNLSTKIWRLENINNNATSITIEENSLNLSPDCSTERVSIYSGDCISPENLVTYFCGGTKDTYKLTTSKKLTVVYSGRPSKASKKERTFKMVINAGLQPSFPPPPPPPVVILVIDDGGAGQSRDDGMVIVVGAVLIVIVLVLIPAVIKMVKKKVRPPTVTPTGPSLGVDIDFAAMGATDLPPPYPGSPAPMEATLGLPQFPRQPSAVSLGETDMTDLPSLDNLDDSEMQTSIIPTPSPRSGQLPGLKTEDSPKRKKKKRKTSILETDLDNVGKVAKGKKDKMKKQ